MKQSTTPAVTLTPAAIAYLLRPTPAQGDVVAFRSVTVGADGPRIQLVRAA